MRIWPARRLSSYGRSSPNSLLKDASSSQDGGTSAASSSSSAGRESSDGVRMKQDRESMPFVLVGGP